MKSRVPYIILLLAFLAGTVKGQVSPLADQYLLNPFLTNPALAGTGYKAPLMISVRQQWLGIKGAPSWQAATYNSMLNAKKQRFNPRGFVNKYENAFGNVGLGGGLFNVRYGAINQTGFHVDYAYHVYMGKGRLSFGLAPMYQQYVINKAGFIPPDGNTQDPLIDREGKEMMHFFDVSAGVQYYSDLLFGGLSVVQLFNSKVSFGELSFPALGDYSDNPWMARTVYLYGGMVPYRTKEIRLEPSVLLRYNGHTGFGFQVHMKMTINDNFQAGVLYRFRESAGLFAGITAGDLIFRYQFEAPLGTAVQTRFTTHQILVGYLF